MFGVRMRVGLPTALALWTVGLVTTALCVLTLVTSLAIPGAVDPDTVQAKVSAVIASLAALFFVPVGAVVIIRGGNRRIGWLLVAAGGALAFDFAVATYGQAYTRRPSLPLGLWSAWFDDFVWMFMILAVWVLVVVFPNGRIATRTGRWIMTWFLLGTVLALTTLPFHSGRLHDQPSLPTPMPRVPVLTAWGDLVSGDVIGLFVLSGFCLALVESVHRYHVAGPTQRVQQRWLAWAFGVTVTVYLLHFVPVAETVMNQLTLVMVPILPLAIGTAMFRERLYDIDRIVSRTVSYGLITALLAAVYAAIVTGASALAPDALGSVGVAAATLVVAALFVPARRRVQGVVDRRFNRAHFSARRTVERFGALARAEPDVQVVGAELLRVVDHTLAPERAGLWLIR